MSIALADLVDPRQITLNLRAETQEEAMREIVGLLVAAHKIDNPQKFVEQLRARETTNSTYAADGVAFPHARTNLVDEIVVGIGRSKTGIPWTGKRRSGASDFSNRRTGKINQRLSRCGRDDRANDQGSAAPNFTAAR